MRIDPDECRDPDLLAAEVRRLNAAIDAGSPTLTDEEREAIEWAILQPCSHVEDRDDTLLKLLARLHT